MRIAMWSGPRNLSTAMMYFFAARGDCAVWDEPFYGAYLADTGLDHPLRAETLAAWPRNAAAAVSLCLGPIPGGKPLFYQKHMTHHMLPGYDLGWVADCRNLFLIRHPARVIASYLAKREAPTAQDIGFARQAELFDEIAGITGAEPAVFDADDIRSDPKRAVAAICAAAGIAFDPAMLAWPAGPIAEDGPWAPHWYGAVHQSTGFAGPEGALPQVPEAQKALLDDAMVHYERLAARKWISQN